MAAERHRQQVTRSQGSSLWAAQAARERHTAEKAQAPHAKKAQGGSGRQCCRLQKAQPSYQRLQEQQPLGCRDSFWYRSDHSTNATVPQKPDHI